MDVFKKLEWRYATKRFDSDKKLNDKQLSLLVDAVNLAPTSYGLQPFALFVIGDSKVREELKVAANGQPQVSDASQVLVFAVNKELSEKHIEAFVERTAQQRGLKVESLDAFRSMMVAAIMAKSSEARFQWAARQAYIALGVLLSTAASENIDACPMEGFNNAEFDRILGLEKKGYSSVVMATVGFRSEEDKYGSLPKVRKSRDELVTFI
jgi:nitroreductase / dihydropteridine reductase